jgi:hypothetical protein
MATEQKSAGLPVPTGRDFQPFLSGPRTGLNSMHESGGS